MAAPRPRADHRLPSHDLAATVQGLNAKRTNAMTAPDEMGRDDGDELGPATE